MPKFDFRGKPHIYAHHLSVPHRPLIPDAARSLNANGAPDGNLIIHGDNLDALKALVPRYADRVKCVYIDPPYNTGKEGWCYNDNVNSPLMREWLKQNGPVDNEDMERHDKWICMMWPRLQLLKELLSEDGMIFVSIDDNECHHLRMMMDEIFGEDNFRNVITVRRGIKNVQSQFEYTDRLNNGQEYIVFYSRFRNAQFPHLTVRTETKPVGKWNNHWRGTDRPTMRYDLMGIIPSSGQWRWSKDRSLSAIKNYNRLIEEIGPDPEQSVIDQWWFAQSPMKPDLLRMSSKGSPEHYIPPSDRRILSSLWTDMTIGESSSSMKNLGLTFSNPKRTDIVKRVVEYACGHDKDAVVLDSFAGSGTTAHAVLALNKKDGGNRKFILVECEDYADSITAERVRRVIRGVPGASARDSALRDGLGGSFTYCTLGPPIELEGMLSGETLPSWTALAAYLLHTASGVSAGPDDLAPQNGDGLFYGDETTDYYLLYRPDLEYLCGHEAMLNSERAGRIHAANRAGGKKAVVFGAGKYITQSELIPMGISFCALPYDLIGRGLGG